MALTKMTTDLNVHQGIPEQPNPGNGYTTSRLKELFDKAPNDIKSYLNLVLLPQLESGGLDTRYYTESESDVKFATRSELQGIILNQIPNGTVTDEKLSDEPGQMKSKMNEFVNGLTDSGYQKMVGGLIIQWGTCTVQNSATVTFPIAFPNGVFNITANFKHVSTQPFYSDDNYTLKISTDLTTNTQFACYSSKYNADFFWLAIGY